MKPLFSTTVRKSTMCSDKDKYLIAIASQLPACRLSKSVCTSSVESTARKKVAHDFVQTCHNINFKIHPSLSILLVYNTFKGDGTHQMYVYVTLIQGINIMPCDMCAFRCTRRAEDCRRLHRRGCQWKSDCDCTD